MVNYESIGYIFNPKPVCRAMGILSFTPANVKTPVPCFMFTSDPQPTVNRFVDSLQEALFDTLL
jgi:hypothetical protein